jgi:hypothetical protein
MQQCNKANKDVTPLQCYMSVTCNIYGGLILHETRNKEEG